ncbi:MAG TPA: formate dehydrogenase subunit delta [Ramlibacter sp.]|nr:formate dehydrogenase subunit delta [Ramlibacter sp.]
MHVDNLIRMANQIGNFFEAMPDRAEAVRDAALHIRRFWEPRMRHELLAHLDGAGVGELNPTMALAFSRHRDLVI